MEIEEPKNTIPKLPQKLNLKHILILSCCFILGRKRIDIMFSDLSVLGKRFRQTLLNFLLLRLTLVR